MITGKRSKNSKRPTDETIITDHSIITNSARNNKKLMNDSNIFDRANKIVKNKLKSETKSSLKLPLHKVENEKKVVQNTKTNFNLSEKKQKNKATKIRVNSLPTLPSVGQGNCELTRKSIHYDF